MTYTYKTKPELIGELEETRRRLAELEASEAGRRRAEEALQESEEGRGTQCFFTLPVYTRQRDCHGKKV